MINIFTAVNVEMVYRLIFVKLYMKICIYVFILGCFVVSIFCIIIIRTPNIRNILLIFSLPRFKFENINVLFVINLKSASDN